MDLLQEIRKEVSLKHTGIKQEPYSAPVQDVNQLQHDITQLQTDIQSQGSNSTHPIPNMLHPLVPVLSPSNNSYLRLKKTSSTYSR